MDNNNGINDKAGDTVLADIFGEEREVTLTWVGQDDSAETGELFQDAKATVDGEEIYLGRRSASWKDINWSRWSS